MTTRGLYTPSIKGVEKLPVIVWIHGGVEVAGGSNDLDSQGHTVVVMINYRLGSLFGFLAHPSVDVEGHLFANYGTPEWMNIGAFGGDAKNVTLGGQSAGSVKANPNVIPPLATDL